MVNVSLKWSRHSKWVATNESIEHPPHTIEMSFEIYNYPLIKRKSLTPDVNIITIFHLKATSILLMMSIPQSVQFYVLSSMNSFRSPIYPVTATSIMRTIKYNVRQHVNLFAIIIISCILIKSWSFSCCNILSAYICWSSIQEQFLSHSENIDHQQLIRALTAFCMAASIDISNR